MKTDELRDATYSSERAPKWLAMLKLFACESIRRDEWLWPKMPSAVCICDAFCGRFDTEMDNGTIDAWNRWHNPADKSKMGMNYVTTPLPHLKCLPDKWIWLEFARRTITSHTRRPDSKSSNRCHRWRHTKRCNPLANYTKTMKMTRTGFRAVPTKMAGTSLAGISNRVNCHVASHRNTTEIMSKL